jgi:acetolactate synthase-1/2/3 large subunit
VILHTNVGLANGVIGAINAATDHVPLLLMSGRTPALEQGRFGARTVPIGWGQEMRDQTALVREACKWDYELRFPEQVPELLDRALAIATSTPRGPVYLGLPREVLCEPCPTDGLAAPASMTPAVVRADPGLIAEAARRLAGAARPLILAQRGAGSADGFCALARLAARHAIPVCQYWAVANAVAADHPLYVGQDPQPWLGEADVVLVLDSLAPWSPAIHELAPGAQVIHLGPDPLYQRFPVRNFRADLAIAGEVGPALTTLDAALQATAVGDDAPAVARRAAVDAHNAARRQRLADAEQVEAGAPMTKAYVAACLRAALAAYDRVTVVSELGVPLDHLGPNAHGSWRQEPHSGGLGWGVPCALGIKLADPERLVVAAVGDGSYLFANPVACHHVAEVHGLATLTVVVNNARYEAVRASVAEHYPTGYAVKADEMPLVQLSPSPDFAMVARSCRAHAEAVADAEALPAALDCALDQVVAHNRPAVLDVHVA